MKEALPKNSLDETDARMKVNPITLVFEGEWAHLEDLFVRAYEERSLVPLRAAVILALLTWSSIGFLDHYLDNISYIQLWAIRYGIGIPVFVAGFLLSFTEFFKRNMQAVVSASVLITGIAISAMIYFARTPMMRDSYYVGLILVFIFAYTLLRLKFVWASVVCWLIVGIYEITAIMIGTPIKVLVSNNFFFINANIIGMFACYFAELSHRKNFFLTAQLELERQKVKKANEELENNVRERTRQLLKINEDLNLMINDFRRSQERLKKSEEKYRTIISSMEEGYYEMDLQCNFTFCNGSTLKIFGHDSPDELIGKNLRAYMEKEHAEQILKSFNSVYQNNVPEKAMNWEIRTVRGDLCFLEVSATRIDENGQPKGFRGIIRDITERKKMERKLLEYYENIRETQTMTILGLAKLAEYRDKDTGEHLERMMAYTRVLTTALAKHPKYRSYITEEYIEDICLSSILHDIGKVGIADEILLKPGPLTPEEYDKVKEHPLFGGDALRAIEERVKGKSFLSLGKEICYHHHERWDGTGYPKGLKGEEIPLSARIVALVDVYDAITSDRVYKSALPHDETVRIIASERGRHFDPDIVDVFLANEEKFREILESSGRTDPKADSDSDRGMAAV